MQIFRAEMKPGSSSFFPKNIKEKREHRSFYKTSRAFTLISYTTPTTATIFARGISKVGITVPIALTTRSCSFAIPFTLKFG